MCLAYKADLSSTDSNYHPAFRSTRWMLAIDSGFCFGTHQSATHGRKKIVVDLFMLDSLSDSLPLLAALFTTTRLSILLCNTNYIFTEKVLVNSPT
jgi:hypothetical protein